MNNVIELAAIWTIIFALLVLLKTRIQVEINVKVVREQAVFQDTGNSLIDS